MKTSSKSFTGSWMMMKKLFLETLGKDHHGVVTTVAKMKFRSLLEETSITDSL
jgi:hypothetical protein